VIGPPLHGALFDVGIGDLIMHFENAQGERKSIALFARLDLDTDHNDQNEYRVFIKDAQVELDVASKNFPPKSPDNPLTSAMFEKVISSLSTQILPLVNVKIDERAFEIGELGRILKLVDIDLEGCRTSEGYLLISTQVEVEFEVG